MEKRLLLVLALSIVVCAFGWSAARPSPVEPEWQRVDLKVEKLFSAHDGDAVFHAYLVKWKDQEVVVEDRLVKTNYHVGDTIPVLVTRLKYPGGKPGPDLLGFMVADTNY